MLTKTNLPAFFFFLLGLAAQARDFDKKLTFDGISYRVQTKEGFLTITPHGLTGSNAPVTETFRGEVTKAEIADLDSDGSPEVYVSIRQPGREQRGTLVAYSANNNKSISAIFRDELPAKALKGYTGRDEFAAVEGTFVHTFPLVGGKTRQFQYKLRAGEAGWRLKLDKTLEY